MLRIVAGLLSKVMYVSCRAFRKGWHFVNFLSHSGAIELGPAAFPDFSELIVLTILAMLKSIVYSCSIFNSKGSSDKNYSNIIII